MSTGPDVTVVPWDHPDAAGLRAEQQAGLAELYDGVQDIEPELPAEQMVHTVLVRVGGEAVATGSLRLEPHLPPGTAELKRELHVIENGAALEMKLELSGQGFPRKLERKVIFTRVE